MRRVAVLGLGPMGAPIARNLIGAGFRTTVWNRTAAKAEPFRAWGATVAECPAEVAAEVILSVLPDVGELDALLPDAVSAWQRAGTELVVVMSTTSPAKVIRLAERLEPFRIRVADAAMSGGDRGARDGTLSLMVGSDDVSWAMLAPILQSIGSTVLRFGEAGAGSSAKLCNQIVVAGTLTALAEALALAERAGIDRRDLLRIFGGGLAASRVLELKGDKLLAADYRVGGSAHNQLKDLEYALQLAASVGARAPLSQLLRELFEEAELAGDGGRDHLVILERFRS